MRLRYRALPTGLPPLFAVRIRYWLAASSGRVASCMPYLHGCSSIGATILWRGSGFVLWFAAAARRQCP